MYFPAVITVAAAFASFAIAHPGHDIREEIREREAALAGLPRDLSHCAEQMKARGLVAKAAARRAQTVRKAREERGLDIGQQISPSLH